MDLTPDRSIALSSAGAPRPIALSATLWGTIGVAIVVALPIGGCASIDHGPDLERAATMVGERVGTVDHALEQGEDPWSGTGWDGASPLDADTAVRTALVRNRSLRASLERIAVARADLVQAGLLPNPVLSVALGFPIDGGGGPVTVGAGVTQSLIALWLRGDRMRAADLELEREILSVSHEALRLVRDVRAAHLRIVHAELELDLLGDEESLLDRLVGLVDARREAGEASLIDVNRVALQRRALHATRIDAERRRDAERLALLALIGRIDAPIDWPVVADERLHGMLPTEPELIELLDARRLDVLAARTHADALAVAAGLAARQRFAGGAGIGAGYDRDDDGRQHLGPAIALEVPIFDTNEASSARAAALHRQALQEAQAVRDRAIGELRLALADAHRLEALRRWCESDLIPAADAQMELVQRVIDAGEVDATALIEAQRERNDARVRLNRIVLDAGLRRLDIEQAVGGGLLP